MVYVPTLVDFEGQMLVNTPYMEHMGCTFMVGKLVFFSTSSSSQRFLVSKPHSHAMAIVADSLVETWAPNHKPWHYKASEPQWHLNGRRYVCIQYIYIYLI